MEVLKVIGIVDSDGHLRLDLETDFPEGRVDLVLVISSVIKIPRRSMIFPT